jgi:acyl-CoA hydrolase
MAGVNRTKPKKFKTPADSAVESRYLVMWQDANPYGTVFGGSIVAWIDMLGSMAAHKHCGKEVVTAAIDSISFDQPIYIGDQVVLKAAVSYVGRTSMEVSVVVIREEPKSGRNFVATRAYLTYVALDKNKKPTAAGALVPKTAFEKKEYENALTRVRARRQLLEKGR